MSLYKRLFARALARGDHAQAEVYAARKRALFADLRGTVLEVGPGTGVNLPLLPPSVERWIGAEPNPHMHRFIREKAAHCTCAVELHPWPAEALPLPAASVNAVIGTLVLCSVDDVAAALRTVRHVLRPGGRFVFIEHVAAPPGHVLRHVQRWIRPVWRPLADGCRPDQDTAALIEQAGFTSVACEHFRADLPLSPITPHIIGTATKAAR